VDVLTQKALRAAREFEVKKIAVVGGVAANRRLREVLPERAKERGFSVYQKEQKNGGFRCTSPLKSSARTTRLWWPPVPCFTVKP